MHDIEERWVRCGVSCREPCRAAFGTVGGCWSLGAAGVRRRLAGGDVINDGVATRFGFEQADSRSAASALTVARRVRESRAVPLRMPWRC